jgi:Zn-dependent M16 (insulinase) family peptidase
MINDPVASAEIYAKTGEYPWIQDGEGLLAILKSLITEKALKDAVRWNVEAYGFPSVFKPELLED